MKSRTCWPAITFPFSGWTSRRVRMHESSWPPHKSPQSRGARCGTPGAPGGWWRAPEQAVNVHEGIEKTLLVLGHKLREGVQIVREYDEHLPTIQANGAELNQVWTNLIDNAIDSLDGRGRIFIRTRHDVDAVIVEIADQGPGIPADLASRIFDPFFTTKDVGKGTGLGLDIVRRIVVDAHHGEIAVESIPGDTRFIVRLPVSS